MCRRSAILSCPFGKVPKTAIPVPIPVVPGSEPSRLAAPNRAPPADRPRSSEPPALPDDITSLVSSIVIATDDSLGEPHY
jgi:hypothetical protein